MRRTPNHCREILRKPQLDPLCYYTPYFILARDLSFHPRGHHICRWRPGHQ